MGGAQEDEIMENTEIRWEPSIYAPGVGVIKLTIEQVRDICWRQKSIKSGGGAGGYSVGDGSSGLR